MNKGNKQTITNKPKVATPPVATNKKTEKPVVPVKNNIPTKPVLNNKNNTAVNKKENEKPVLGKKRKDVEEEEEEEDEEELSFGNINEDGFSDEDEEGDDEEEEGDDDEEEEEDEEEVATFEEDTGINRALLENEDSLVEYNSDDGEEESINSGNISSSAATSGAEEDGKRWSSDPNQFYDSEDSSEDETIVNRIGNIPIEWYDDFDHIGYDVDGNKIMRSESTKDSIDRFLDQQDPNFWRTVYDKVNDKKVVLSDEDMQLLKNIQNRNFIPGFNPYEDWYDPGPNPDSIHPLHNAPVPKRSFLPFGTDEEREIRRLTHAIRMGWIKISHKKKEKKNNFDLWGDGTNSEEKQKGIKRIPAPKQRLPGNVESFNPPEEYLLTDDEVKAWHLMDPRERPHNFIPQKYKSLRQLPIYNKLIKERFERCLDLYLCPRKLKTREFIKDETKFLPKLPKPQDLRPFPSHEELQFLGHSARVRSISISPNGQWLASGSDDCTIKIWEISSTRCVYSLKVENEIQSVAWNPNPLYNILAASYSNKIIIITPPIYGPEQNQETEKIITKPNTESTSEEQQNKSVNWYNVTDSTLKERGVRIEIHHPFTVKNLTWHYKGDYFSSTSPEEGTRSVKIHHLSKRATQTPFRRSKTPNQVTRFHPSKPIFFVADQNIIRVYDLMKQELIKKLITGCRYISSIDIHPGGDNVIMGGYDKRVSWFDLDLSTRPYKVLNYHKMAVRKVIYHPTLPIFASCSDDLSIHVFHGMVYDDLLQNALIVPLKILKTHQSVNDLGVLDIAFHPKQPWIFSSGADSTIRLYT
ncbi:hypothetical protein DICPUDRAFT_150881 [Dictyostelium purpureum]|uniref:Ribosome biogenesis protein BOP1 homolog n=1 Tax=Dictyostelium purpureum TaxID=5786 RepID=F0ZHH5_DICPU|nr:uncharacterized protein DICPUDRAFT_150881 [Dictyostelium purpureum]EGC36633.1 hypothetical protein DICPUDRAFT_150881 [Dictyostelium purpureum]|eukprot:XP_003286871.1 hypothetical protein DICPUDRAFT_150881 [Dictyostelium purpureum]